MSITTSQLNAVLKTLREVGYTGLDECEQQIVQAFNDGSLEVGEDSPEPETEIPAGNIQEDEDNEFQPKERNLD